MSCPANNTKISKRRFNLLFTLIFALPGCAGLSSSAQNKEQAPMDARDFAVINAVMDDFTKDHVMLDGFIAVLGTGTLFLRVKDEVSECKNFNKLADGLLENNVYPSRLDSLVPTSSLWRLEKEGDDENRLERKIGTFVNITRPAYDIDGKSAAVFLTFSMGMHGDSGYYVLTENNDNWKIECKTFRFGL